MKEKVVYIADNEKEINIMNYIKFYDMHKNEIIFDRLDKYYFIQAFKYNNKLDSEYCDYFAELVQDIYFIHVANDIPAMEIEKELEKMLLSFLDIAYDEITQFNFEKGITYFYDEENVCFTNTVYEEEKVKKQIEFLTELKNLE